MSYKYLVKLNIPKAKLEEPIIEMTRINPLFIGNEVTMLVCLQTRIYTPNDKNHPYYFYDVADKNGSSRYYVNLPLGKVERIMHRTIGAALRLDNIIAGEWTEEGNYEPDAVVLSKVDLDQVLNNTFCWHDRPDFTGQLTEKYKLKEMKSRYDKKEKFKLDTLAEIYRIETKMNRMILSGKEFTYIYDLYPDFIK